MLYQELLQELNSYKDVEYDKFNVSLLGNVEVKTIGVRVPILRQIAKKYSKKLDELLACPNDYYEVRFIKCVAVCGQPFDAFIRYVDEIVPLMNNWALCDSSINKDIKKHRQEFLPFIKKYLAEDKEFYQRFALITLLDNYIVDDYLPFVFDAIQQSNSEYYYTYMGAAWLLAEVLVFYFDEGIAFLQQGNLPKRTHNKAIQKARESYRLTDTQKQFLNGLKK